MNWIKNISNDMNWMTRTGLKNISSNKNWIKNISNITPCMINISKILLGIKFSKIHASETKISHVSSNQFEENEMVKY